MRNVGAIAGVALAAIVVVGTVVFMERSRDVSGGADGEGEALAKITAAAPAPPAPPVAAAPPAPRYQIGGAAAQQAIAPDLAPPAAATRPAPTAPAVATAAPFQPLVEGETPWGRPGRASAPLRVVELEIRELHDGRILFDVAGIPATANETLRIVVRNSGEFPHSIVIATPDETARYIDETKRNPAYWQDQPNWLFLPSGGTGEIVWQFTRGGQFEFSALSEGDRKAGLFGRIAVR